MTCNLGLGVLGSLDFCSNSIAQQSRNGLVNYDMNSVTLLKFIIGLAHVAVFKHLLSNP
jgi:hypothetical protein